MKLRDELLSLGVKADIDKIPDPLADVNHHIAYLGYTTPSGRLDTLMVTHIDSLAKRGLLMRQLETAALGICMSSHAVNALVNAGIPREKLCHVVPAHDGVMSPRSIVIGITTRTYTDGRKREYLLTRLAERIDLSPFHFCIMGAGWDEVVEKLRPSGASVDYISEFAPERYRGLIAGLDYYLYLGCDEGSMGFVDALAAGVATIVTPQGFHLDAPGAITHSFETEDDLIAVFLAVAEERMSRVRAVQDWTWRNYAIKHLDVWGFLQSGLAPAAPHYSDGVASLATYIPPPGLLRRTKALSLLVRGSIRGLTAGLRAFWARR
ncbi:MAG: hypothetical protein HYV06_07595 [Deltaproteobacteria bacterium]|nr:hypothetical protein [Deltaproteobacteria bacterium]